MYTFILHTGGIACYEGRRNYLKKIVIRVLDIEILCPTFDYVSRQYLFHSKRIVPAVNNGVLHKHFSMLFV